VVLVHRDTKTITYNEVVTALLTDVMQQKLLVFVHKEDMHNAMSGYSLCEIVNTPFNNREVRIVDNLGV
jgi:hypothetical protein